jgi:endoglucanase
LADIKTLPQWMLDSYPADQQDVENVPVMYGKDFSDPNSYIEQAKLAFQFAARYGSNKNVNTGLLSVDPTVRWTGDVANTVKVGLGLIRYIECDNERDKWWKGRKAYQTAYEYAANLSAFYDGNKNTMGPGVGVKNADPNMQVVMCGTALATTDYIRGMVDWCKQHRGYKSDGTVNLCWDVINYHLYSNNAGTSQGGNSTNGAAPETSGAAATAQDFINAAHRYVQDMPIWVTELGYDLNQGSPLKAISIGTKSALQVEADWELRSSLLYARSGVQRAFFYEMYDQDASSTTQFASSGLMNTDGTRRPAADYLYQANKLLGAYSYSYTVANNPIVDVYSLKGKNAYVLVMPTQNGSTATYNLDLEQADSAFIYTPAIGSDNMSVRKIKATNGKINLTVTETPTFVIPSGFVPIAVPDSSPATVPDSSSTSNSSSSTTDSSSSTSNSSSSTTDSSSSTNNNSSSTTGSSSSTNNNSSTTTDSSSSTNNNSLTTTDSTSSSNDKGNNTSKSELTVYPNPFEDYININYENEFIGDVTINIYDILGRLIKRYNINKSSEILQERIDVSMIREGAYILQLRAGNAVRTNKIIKTK